MDSISILDTGFTICLAFTILFFIISLVLFFFFDIKTIFNIRTGRAQAKTVKEMKNANASTGRLRVAGKTQTSKLDSDAKGKTRPPVVSMPVTEKISNNQAASIEKSTDVISQGSENTTLLTADAGATEVLTQQQGANVEFGGTTVLSEIDRNAMNNNIANAIASINFKVIKKQVYIHTNEIIN